MQNENHAVSGQDSRECCFRTDGQPFSKAVWEVTFTCSLRCPYCFQERTGHRSSFTSNAATTIRARAIEFLEYMRPAHVLLSGGEPLTLGKNLFPIINAVQRLGATFSISTTGFPLRTFQQALDAGPSGINISIDPAGLTGKVYAYRKTRYETLLRTLRETARRGIPVKGTSLITTENLKNVRDYALTLRKLVDAVPNLRALYITNPYHIGYTRPDLSVRPEKVEAFIETLRTLIDLPLDLQFVNFSAIAIPLHACPAASSVFCLVPNGDVVGCPFLYQRSSSFAVGNVVDNSPATIRKGLQRFRGFLEQSVEHLLRLSPECQECPSLGDCHGGCFAETFAMKETSIPSLICKRTVETARKRNGTLLSLPLQVRAKLRTGKPRVRFRRRSLPAGLESQMADYIQEYMTDTFSDIAHRYDHVECVVRLAKRIVRAEGANPRIVIPAAYFHDVAPRQHEAFHFHTDASADAAAEFLSEHGFSTDEVVAIVHCIVASEFSSYLLGIEPRSLEAMVVRDADFLESMGARGIARVFSFAGAHCDRMGELDYDPSAPAFAHHNIMAPDETPIQHFAAKLLRLNDLLLTREGKRLGRKRHRVMLGFLVAYGQEMRAQA